MKGSGGGEFGDGGIRKTAGFLAFDGGAENLPRIEFGTSGDVAGDTKLDSGFVDLVHLKDTGVEEEIGGGAVGDSGFVIGDEFQLFRGEVDAVAEECLGR